MLDERLGDKLAEAGPNIGKILLNCAIRAAIIGLVLMAGFAENGFSVFWAFMFFISLIIIAFPLRHLRDKVEYYSNGISYHQKNYFLAEIGSVEWMTFKSSGFFEDLFMDTDAGRFVFTYVKDAKKQYNKAYRNQMNGGNAKWS